MHDSKAAIRAVVRRLSRPDGQGGAVIERAAIIAEGKSSAAIEAWVIDNGGQPEVVTLDRPGEGLHPFRRDAPPLGGRTPGRYVLPAAALGSLS
ncbi:hypothetical protein [Solirubrobacter deserti]|uniref:Uncharacterized protein n=1 Tax=Solirubrobacter deserti TaxID=2282478 RepID=A0ABT4RP84_9ACTN|nr:hypothetical protein [Solirubrobacter deserti]MDA0140377.1 hypothetical protein [Solirubrobacter deserti]